MRQFSAAMRVHRELIGVEFRAASNVLFDEWLYLFLVAV
jgi:hypothetical protein